MWWKQQECVKERQENINETCICEHNDTDCDENSKCAKCVTIWCKWKMKLCFDTEEWFEKHVQNWYCGVWNWTEKQCDIGVQEKPCNLNWQWLLIKVYVRILKLIVIGDMFIETLCVYVVIDEEIQSLFVATYSKVQWHCGHLF